MGPKRRTWIWVLVALFGLGLVFVIGIVGFGVYFISSHVKAGESSATEAFRAFEEARAPFKEQLPVFELDKNEEPRMIRRFEDLPTASSRAETLYILAWDPDRERLIRVSIPFWLLRLGKQKIDITSDGFDLQRLQLDVEELSRVGPVVLFDFRPPDGDRVFVWTR